MMISKGQMKAGVAAAAAATLVVAGCAAPARTTQDGDYTKIVDQIAEYASVAAKQAQVPAFAIGIITNDGLVAERYLGTNAAGDPLTADTLFEIGSATKAFLGVTEAMLVDRGDLKWHDRVIDHAPQFELHDPWVTAQFRIDDLIAQRSGLGEYSSELPAAFGFDWSENVRGLKYLEPETSFRSTFAYQNMPHYVAGEIVADHVGAPSWNAAVEEMLFEPLDMTNSYTGSDALAQSNDATRGHTMLDGALHERPLEAFPSVAQGAGSITSSLHDMSKWIGLHLAKGKANGHTVVSSEQLEYTYLPLVPVTDPQFLRLVSFGEGANGESIDTVGYATGWFVHSLPQGRVIEHGGNTQGYNSAVMFDPDRGVGLVVLSNQGFQGGVATQVGKYGMDLLQGREPLDYLERARAAQTEAVEAERIQAESSQVQRLALDAYAGVYEHELLGALEVREVGQRLVTRVGPQQHEGAFEHKTGHTFSLSWQPADAGLERNTETVVFDGGGERPAHLTIGGFVFVRAQ